MAVGALSYLRARGISVPDELSVVGFDDMPVAGDVTPRLTTIRLPLVEMGVRAMAMALDEAAGSGARVEHLDATLVIRESTAPPRTL